MTLIDAARLAMDLLLSASNAVVACNHRSQLYSPSPSQLAS